MRDGVYGVERLVTASVVPDEFVKVWWPLEGVTVEGGYAEKAARAFVEEHQPPVGRYRLVGSSYGSVRVEEFSVSARVEHDVTMLKGAVFGSAEVGPAEVGSIDLSAVTEAGEKGGEDDPGF